MTYLPEVTRFGSFTCPDASLHSRNQDRRLAFGKSQPQAKAGAEPAAGSVPPVAGLEGATADVQQHGPLSDKTGRAERARSILRPGAALRPLRTSVVGVPLKVAPADKTIFTHACAISASLVKFHSPYPKAKFSPSHNQNHFVSSLNT